jgi:archaemetzincin
MKQNNLHKLKIIIFTILILFSCQPEKQKQSNQKDKVSKPAKDKVDYRNLNRLNTKLSKPVMGEWLFSQKESGQSFKRYINSTHICPDSLNNVIYLNLIGEFDDVDMGVLKKLKEYTEIFFRLKVVMREPVSDDIIPEKSRRFNMENEQLHTTYILQNILKQNFPKDALVNMAITSADLYPRESWNFVFGQASLRGRVGVSSIFRYKHHCLDSVNCSKYMNRIMKTTTHEIMHMLYVKHCKDYKCLMNGSISLLEADKKPSWLCAECLAKLIWCTQTDVIKRYDDLIRFSEENNYPDKAEFYKKSKAIMTESY